MEGNSTGEPPQKERAIASALLYTIAMTKPINLPPADAANTNDDPFATVTSSLDWLYLLRHEILKEDINTMSFERRRSRDEALKKFAHAEALLLKKL